MYYILGMAKHKVPKEKFDRTAGDPRRAAFERLFGRRLDALKEDARLLINLSNPYNYAYNAEDLEEIVGVLEAIQAEVRDAYHHGIHRQKSLSSKRNLGVK